MAEDTKIDISKIVIRCTRVVERPDVSAFKSHNPKIGQCDECRADIWITDQSREVAKHLGKEKSIIVCKQCALNLSVNYLKKNEREHNIVHLNSDATEITQIKILDTEENK